LSVFSDWIRSTSSASFSGAGPTVMTLVSKEKEAELVERIQSLNFDGEVVALQVDTKGVFVEKN